MSGWILAAVTGGMFVLALLAVPLTRRYGRDSGYVLAGSYAVALVALGALGREVLAGETVRASSQWLPSLGPRLTLHLDGLALLFSGLVLGIGALVMAYTARYSGPGSRPVRLYSMLTFFAASMLGLVLAGDVILLFVFWELTSISSFFLIGGTGGSTAAKAATRAFLVTGLGGLALLAGLVLLAVASGSWDLATILENPEVVREGGAWGAILALVLIGAFTKSAQFPFHFWLPGAMVAPTPVSTYLHAATMVKAGIYLLARMTPVFEGEAAWFYSVTFVGLATAVIGAALALAQYDLKSLLAYSTVSQLGLLVALVGVGTYRSMAAASLHLIAHALYKATLFMVVGVIDTEAGSRDIRLLSGLARAMPLMATATGLAALSMAGVPPFLGFISKEEAFDAFLRAPGPAWVGGSAAALAVAASIMTFAYGARIVDGAFGGPVTQRLYPPPRSFVAPAVATAGAGIAFALAVPLFDPLVNEVVTSALGIEESVHFALWHGFTTPLALSALTVAAGVGLFLARRRIDRITHRIHPPVRGTTVFDALHDGAVALGRTLGAPFLSRAPAPHLVWVLATTAAVGLGAWFTFGRPSDVPAPPSVTTDWVIAGLLLVAGVVIALSRARLGAVAVLGIAGFVVALLYVTLGAPDLALTQLLIETLTVVLVVMVFRRLRSEFHPVAAWRRAVSVVVALAAGGLAGVAAYTLTGHRELSVSGGYYLEAGPRSAGGQNIVNTILVDFRALDTLGEISVLAVAASGVYLLVRSGRVGP